MIYRIPSLKTAGKITAMLAAAAIVQGVFAFRFSVFGYFDLPLVISVYYGFTLGNPIAAIFIGSGVGLMQDSLSGAALGTNGFSKTLIGFLAASAGSKFDIDQPVAQAGALFLFTILDGLVVSILGLIAGDESGTLYRGGPLDWFLPAVFNTLLGLVFLGLRDRSSHAAK